MPRARRTGTIQRYAPARPGERLGHFVVRCSAPDGTRPIFHLDPSPPSPVARAAALVTAEGISETLWREGLGATPRRGPKPTATPEDADRWFDAWLADRKRRGLVVNTAGPLRVHIRAELDGERERGSTPRFTPVRPFALGLLLSGMRLGEATALTWAAVDLDAGELHLSAATKTHRARTVDLAVAPLLEASLASLRPPKPDPAALVWGLTYGAAVAAQRRLRASYGAPSRFSWQVLRSTCATYLTNSGGIFGGASAYRSARQLGHSVQVAERHYLGTVRVDLAARTLEAAMGIAPLDAGDGATS